MADQSAAPSAAPDRPGAGNAISLNENDLADAMWQVRWQSLRTFYSAPCLAQSVLLGIGGGAGIGALRALGPGPRSPRNAWTVGCVVGGMLYGSSWYVCRRALWASRREEQQLLQRVNQGDPEALQEYGKRCAPTQL